MDLSNNRTLESTESTTKTQLDLYEVLIPSLGVFTMLLNVAVVISSGLIIKRGQHPKSTYLFMGNIALADLLTGISVVFGHLYPIDKRTHTICSIQLGIIVTSTLTSIYTVGLIGIDRFLFIMHGIQYKKWMGSTAARTLIIISWTIGCSLGFLPLFGWSGNTDNGQSCWFIFLAPRNLIVLTVAVGTIPICTVTVLCLIILYHALKKMIQQQMADKKATTQPNQHLRKITGKLNKTLDMYNPKRNNLIARIFRPTHSPDISTPSKWRAVKLVLVTCGSFVLTWCPYFIACLYYVYKCQQNDTKKCRSLSIVIASPLAILGFSYCLINPVIYAWWHQGFRTYVQKRVSIVVEKARRASHAIIHSEFADTISRKMSTVSTSLKFDKNRSSISIVPEETTISNNNNNNERT